MAPVNVACDEIVSFSFQKLSARLIKTATRRGRFRADERGVTAIEFAMLALPFFAIIGAILETAMIFFASQILDSALNNSSRLIRTGQTQAQGYDADAFRTAVCGELFGMFDCNSVKVRVSEIVTFSAAGLSSVVDPDTGEWTLSEVYDDGVGSSIILVEAYYKWSTFMDFFSFNLSNLADGTRLLSAVRVFRNEPF